MRASHEILKDAFTERGPKSIAGEMGVSLSTVYKWAQPVGPQNSGARNPLDRAAALMRHCGFDEELIQWLCHEAGGFFVRDPSGTSECRDLLPATNEIIQEFADMLGVIAAAGADNQISATEARVVRRRWEQLKTVTESFVKCCEEGHFDALRDAAGGSLEHAAECPCGENRTVV